MKSLIHFPHYPQVSAAKEAASAAALQTECDAVVAAVKAHVEVRDAPHHIYMCVYICIYTYTG